MSGNSSVGNAGVYEAGDQRNYKDSELNQKEQYNEGKEHAHNNLDSSKRLDPHLFLSRRLLTKLNRGRAIHRQSPGCRGRKSHHVWCLMRMKKLTPCRSRGTTRARRKLARRRSSDSKIPLSRYVPFHLRNTPIQLTYVGQNARQRALEGCEDRCPVAG